MARTGVRAVAVIVKNNKVALIHRKKEGRDYWVFPGGGVENGETPEDAAVREVKEELSIDCKVVKLFFSVESYPGGNKDPYFLCTTEDNEIELGGPEKQRQSKENWYSPQWVELEKVKHLNLLPETAKGQFLEKVISELKLNLV